MDIKTTPLRYADLICPAVSKFFGKKEYWANLLIQSAKILSKLEADKREFRTVLVPELVTKDDIKAMAEILPKDASWQFAQFMNKNCLDPAYNEITPYTDEEIQEIITYAKSLIPGAELR